MRTLQTAPLLAARGITKSYGEGNKRLLVLDDISIEIPDGQIVAILGPSGSGKSTLMRILAGLALPTAGSVEFHGQVHQGLNSHIAIVFQTFALFPWLTVYQNVELGLLSSDVSETQRRRRILEAIDLIGLDGFEDAFPKELSGGMRQRVGFARALVVQPEILFMDEPFSALDVLTAENLRKELLALWRSQKIPTHAILLVTHNIEEAVLLGDRLVIMGQNPGIVRVNMPGLPVQERSKDHPEHTRLVNYVYRVITNPDEEIPPFSLHAPAVRRLVTPERAFQALPHVPVGRITGLVERLHGKGDRVDLYVLGRELQMHVDDLLPLVQAIDMLGLGDIEAGDVYLTSAGIRFAEGDVLEEKQLFSEQARTCIQLIRLVLQRIEEDPHQRVHATEIRQELLKHFGPEEADRQIETVADWGRYAELFSFDEAEGAFYGEDPD